MMVTPIGSINIGRPVDQLRVDSPKAGAQAAAARAVNEDHAAAVTHPVKDMVAQGAPVDTAKVEQIKAALASGQYKVDPQAIADKMIAQDLPAKS